MKRVHITTNACPRRQLDKANLTKYFQRNGYLHSPDPSEADFNIFISCAALPWKVDESIELIDEFQRYPGEFIVMGCFPDIEPVTFKEHFQGRFLTTRNIEKIDSFFPDFKIPYSSIGDSNHFVANNQNLIGKLLRPMATIQELTGKSIRTSIQTVIGRLSGRILKDIPPDTCIRIGFGCGGGCAYCSIYKAVGRHKSKPPEVCGSEYQNLLEKGHRRFWLLADNLGLWGSDIGKTLPDLLAHLSEIDHKDKKIYWYLHDLHPEWVIKYKDGLESWIRSGKIYRILCPFQSGSNRILNLMNRNHTIEKLTTTLNDFKSLNSHLQLDAHIMVGFPSETEPEFEESLRALTAAKFDCVSFHRIHYAHGSIANTMHDQKICETEIQRRLDVGAEFCNRHGIYFHTEGDPRSTWV